MKAKKPAPKSAIKKYYKPSESRRGFLRVELEPGYRISLDGGPTYQVQDVSVYGTSFLVGPADTKRFVLGAEFPSITFTIRNREITVGGKVAYLQPDLIVGMVKVAVEFTEVAIEDVWFLSQFIAEKAQVHKPSQIGAGTIGVEDLLLFREPSRKKRKAKAKPKPKKKAKAKAKSKAKPKSKKKPRKKST